MKKLFTYDATFKRMIILCTEKTDNCAAGEKCAVMKTCICDWQSIKTRLFSSLTNRNPETDPSVLEYFKDL
jgi:hypothetical protein